MLGLPQIFDILDVATPNGDLLSPMGELERVGQQVQDDLLDSLLVGTHGIILLIALPNYLILIFQLREVLKVQLNLHACLFGLVLLNHDDFFNRLLQVEVAAVLSELTGPKLRKV